MSSRIVINLLFLALAGFLFVVCPEQRAAERAGISDRLGDRSSALLRLGSDADPGGLAASDEPSRAEISSADSWPGVFGRAIDLAGEGVPGLSIYLSQPSPSHDGLEGTTRDLSAVTAPDGSFEFLVAETPGALTLGSNAWALLGERRERRGAWRIHCELLVTEAVQVLGQVTGPSGRPLAGTEVVSSAQFPLPSALSDAGDQGSFEHSVLSGEDGGFDLGPVPRLASSRIVFDAPGLDPVERRVPSGGVRVMRVVLH